MRSSINELDHILPEVTFPTVETLKDATLESFIYVLGNLLRTRRYALKKPEPAQSKIILLALSLLMARSSATYISPRHSMMPANRIYQHRLTHSANVRLD
jgi:hypothetical protein